MTPQVRDLQSLIAEQTKSLQPQMDLINKDITANDNSGAAQVAGLDAKKTQEFKTIDQNAQDKGMFFSGFSPDAQAEYTAGTYLPALAQLQSTIAQTRSGLLGKKADLNKGAFDTAVNIRENDVKTLADWNSMTATQQFNASESDKQRVFQAKQNEADRAQSAANNAASIEANRINPVDKKVADVGAAHGYLQSVSGADHYVSQRTYAQAKALWVSEGYNGKEFDQSFATYRNPDNNQYKLD